MDPTISVSKGCFVFNGHVKAGGEKGGGKKSATKRRRRTSSASSESAPGYLSEMTSQPCYAEYKSTWQRMESDIEALQRTGYAKTLEELIAYVASTMTASALNDQCEIEEILPTAALLTGINQTDHLEQFETLAEHIRNEIAASVCVLQSRDCPTLKAAMETLVHNFMDEPQHESTGESEKKRLRRSQCTMRQLKRWYANNHPSGAVKAAVDEEAGGDDDTEDGDSDVEHKRHALVVVLPDFECFAASVLQDLILILSTHSAQLPFVLILGVATTVSAVHNALPYHVTSKIRVRIFKTPSAIEALNEMLERIVLSPRYAFHLSGKAFKFLTHIFLYYDFSIHGFVQGLKYCLMEHYLQGNIYALCTSYSASLLRIKDLTHDDMEGIRRLLSFRPYVEGLNDCRRVIAILTDDDYLKKKLPQLLSACHCHFLLLRIFIEFVAELVGDLPKCPLGKLRRELYATCLSKDLTAQPEFKECWQLLSLMSKQDFVAKVKKAIDVTVNYLVQEFKGIELATDCAMVINQKMMHVKQSISHIDEASTQPGSATTAKTSSTSPTAQPAEQLKQASSRHDLKERLLQMTKLHEKPSTEYACAVGELLAYIEREIVHCHLTPLQRAPPLHELFVFSDIATVRRNIIGAPRAALHMALNNPHFYLQCKCCPLDEAQQLLLPSLPDLSVAYKLHLECGRMINLFDWLQAFRAVVENNKQDDEGDGGGGGGNTAADEQQIDPQIQARFTRAVAELQFLGYIKMSKRKTDHATRLTW